MQPILGAISWGYLFLVNYVTISIFSSFDFLTITKTLLFYDIFLEFHMIKIHTYIDIYIYNGTWMMNENIFFIWCEQHEKYGHLGI